MQLELVSSQGLRHTNHNTYHDLQLQGKPDDESVLVEVEPKLDGLGLRNDIDMHRRRRKRQPIEMENGLRQSTTFKIVHIGDSYSAGNGLPDHYGPRGCFRSHSNWGEQYAKLLLDEALKTNSDSGARAKVPRYFNRACSGNTLEHYFKRRLMDKTSYKYEPYAKLGLGYPTGCVEPVSDDEEIIESKTLMLIPPFFWCERYIKPMKESITQDTDLVLMTLGGNLTKWSDIILRCFASRSHELCQKAINYSSSVINGNGEGPSEMYSQLVEVLEDMFGLGPSGKRLLRPGAKVVIGTYPHLIWDKPHFVVAASITSFVLKFQKVDITSSIRKVRDDLEYQQHMAVQDVLAKLSFNPGDEPIILISEFSTVMAGPPTHEPDPDTISSNDDGWIVEYSVDGGKWYHDWYHPNKDGHQAWAKVLSTYGDFGIIVPHSQTGGSIDLALVIDATGSMFDYISQVRDEATELVSQLEALSASFRVALVSYKDNDSYLSKVDLDFTDVGSTIKNSLDDILSSVSGGGDDPETVLSGINSALGLNWRAGASKHIVILGDGPAKIGEDGKEPYSGLTAEDIISKSIAIDPVVVSVVDLKKNLAQIGSVMEVIVEATGGIVRDSITDASTTLKDVIENAAQKPRAWFGESIIGKIGEPVKFDARSSFDPKGAAITTYEWDFDGSGDYDTVTDSPMIEHIFPEAFDGYTVLRVKSTSGVSLASAHVLVNEEGSAPQFLDEHCEVDAFGIPIVEDDEGSLLCKPWPDPGIYEIAGDDACDTIESLVEQVLESPLQQPEGQDAVSDIEELIEIFNCGESESKSKSGENKSKSGKTSKHFRV